MTEEPASKRALDTLLAVRAEQFEDVPEEILEQVYKTEHGAQFDSDRRPTVAKLRDLIMNRGDE